MKGQKNFATTSKRRENAKNVVEILQVEETITELDYFLFYFIPRWLKQNMNFIDDLQHVGNCRE